jgi:protein-S-isoprenylcysteine O-methyltransferase Ste14
MFNSTFKIIFLIEVIAITAIRSFYTLGKKPHSKKRSLRPKADRLFMILEVIGMIIPFVYVFTTALDFANYNSPQWIGWTGSTIFLLAILLLWRAHHDLGRFWAMDLSIMKEHMLIKTGVYKYIRHPLYASHMIWAIAQVLMLSNWIAGYSFIIVFLPHYIYRVSKEEKMLISEFEGECTNYMRETGRLFPRLRKR